MSDTFFPPASITPSFLKQHRVFLAGSIEMGKATEWQANFTFEVSEFIRERTSPPYLHRLASYSFYNPRRKDWDSEWKQGFAEPQFYQQVNWELDALDKATHIIMYLEPGTQSPISLLELGLQAKSGKLLVVCPEGFWRKGNVDVVCNRYGILQFNTLSLAASYLANQILKG
ncbi:nucleoside 2-deoxyribosyltransferase domain-containing protein [Hymenobacter sp. H14-R3]|uniref:nucleoside 2-deoxyribosyltransferase domain-containing protein n=1 Tax=Hymenobacter sp. H14-R3 TaxID=3046308 RepID=UPI0024BBDD20|nr:nucleoside 2-deoxyribosyltransferase domain-containing protein [Hymenobacter sp. H14-R3]MDJ0367016.1 nucleoside 2-deoxyribosyltransferase domain-containing protein [Hymenobacter sp. H14-R3]